MDHSSYTHIVQGSKIAVLLIHGIAGTPAHFRDLLPVIPQDWSVYNLLLDGHGKQVADFGATSMKKWVSQVRQALADLLAQHAQVFLIAHSMGTLFAIRAALDRPDRIPCLFLLAVPTRPWVRFSTVLTAFRVARGNIRPGDHRAIAMKNDTSIQLEPQLWKYLPWIPRFAELLTQIRWVRKNLHRLNVPCQTFQSYTDELVSIRSCRDLESNPCIHNTVLYHSGHFQYGEEDIRLLQSQLRQCIARLQTKDDTNTKRIKKVLFAIPRSEATSKDLVAAWPLRCS